ncbi:MBL fold metallo-hydrolase [Leptospira wolffii]|uniref:MBL fold metallo-hydrolase RNA specificity domain-containing protein n=1 Tax=Leptospira wolffii TaxID=409998 RepID=UPI001083B198|nr:MBL fold metallo-hydrolase [Leptospira wolffii]TGL55434.1 MBL fold metallo-hydrolase [Leptospira wolffii]
MSQENSNTASLQFLGGAGTVTGSKYLLEAYGKRILIDCGLFQGEKELRLLNWEAPPFESYSIDTVLLTHGHLDHCGYLPRIVKEGFQGKILGTAPSLDIASIVLKDSARLQEEDASYANSGGYSKHKPALPLYDSKDADNAIQLFHSVEMGRWTSLHDKIRFRFRYAGHILGAAFIELEVGEKTLLFSGDLGRSKDPLLLPLEKPEKADLILIESTYGNRLHRGNPEKRLVELVNEFADSEGSIIIPSFAVERAQLLMFLLWKFRKEKRIPNIPIYLDSPMGLHVFEVFEKYGPEWHKLSPEDSRKLNQDIIKVVDAKETKKLASKKGPRIVIAGSGMATGGRVLNYLQHSLGDPNSLVLLAGYQAAGTRGRKLLQGDTEIKIRGQFYEVLCEVQSVDGLSAHADQKDLVEWLSDLKGTPEKVCIVHGEGDAAQALGTKIRGRYGWNSHIPVRNEKLEFEV